MADDNRDDYDEQLDGLLSYNEAIRWFGEEIKAGRIPLPEWFLPSRKGEKESQD